MATEAFIEPFSNDSYGSAWDRFTADIAMGTPCLRAIHNGAWRMSGYVDDLFGKKRIRKHGAGFSCCRNWNANAAYGTVSR